MPNWKKVIVSGSDAILNTITGSGGIQLADDAVLNIGDGNDLQLYHDGSNSYIKDNVMGWNSQFVQTGPAGLGKLNKICKGNPDLENILKKANSISKNILELVQPSVVIHFGKPSALASGSYQDQNLETLRASNPKNTKHGGKRVVFHHPSQGYSNRDRDEDIDLLIDLLSAS